MTSEPQPPRAGEGSAHPGQAGEAPTTDRLNDRSDYQRCFACGPRNPYGLQLVFRQEGDEVVTEFTADARYQGFPGVLHGGIVATLLDETLERVSTLEGRWLMTGRLEVRYRRAVPVERPLRIAARAVDSRARMLVASATMTLVDQPGVVVAEAQGTFLPLPPDIQTQVSARYPAFAHAFDALPTDDA